MGIIIHQNTIFTSENLYKIEINQDLALEISKSGITDFDDFAHSRDHCLEVQIPFLQYINKNKKAGL